MRFGVGTKVTCAVGVTEVGVALALGVIEDNGEKIGVGDGVWVTVAFVVVAESLSTNPPELTVAVAAPREGLV